ncbi:spore germination protein [Paenibacillus glycanilyticus]|uniref:spore germination protein n=1 Tax=Paenibacillus glycanilyticus TaxID=126569 RepID=UPI002041A7E8|nr:spore germination protein [Paenibacillus glycanilyticus]MCM3626664.1 spore germination protein [Paenibacillus glycanilyticus]
MLSSIKSHIPGWEVFFQALLTLAVPIVIYRIYAALNTLAKDKSGSAEGVSQTTYSGTEELPDHPFSRDYDNNMNRVREAIGANSDVIIRELAVGDSEVRAALVFVKGMQEDQLLKIQIMQMLLEAPFGQSISNLIDRIPTNSAHTTSSMDEFTQSILFGYMALIIDGHSEGLLINPPCGPSRDITEPLSESLLRGSRVGFTEELNMNTAMIRKQGLTGNLQIRSYRVGDTIQKELAIVYLNDIVNPDLLKEVHARIESIKIDFAAESGSIEQLIEDNYLSPFQQAQNTERPDRVIAALLEGKIAILLDGTPFALIVPVTFSMLLQSPEDYFERWLPGTLLRMLRFLAAFIAVMAPSLYISFISFHPGLIPTELALTIIETRQGVPFPALIEVMILEISIEILREAGIRLPKPIGPAMGIVGGLVIGEAAVQAGIVSPFLVIVVAVTAISSFSIPVYSAGITLRMLRFVAMLFAAILGMYGTILFFLLVCCHLSKLKSFGVPYLTPITPYRLSDWKDFFVRMPIFLMNRRPKLMKTKQNKRR